MPDGGFEKLEDCIITKHLADVLNRRRTPKSEISSHLAKGSQTDSLLKNLKHNQIFNIIQIKTFIKVPKPLMHRLFINVQINKFIFNYTIYYGLL